MIIESCCTTPGEALSAQARGADRIELCTDLSVGGVTPSRELIRETVSRIALPVHVLVRDAACLDFVYDDETVRRMTDEIAFCRTAGAAGVVVGALDPDGRIDEAVMQRLVAAAKDGPERPLSVTFHRAFDVGRDDPFEALRRMAALGCDRLLTSGRAETAWDGRDLIAALVRFSAENATGSGAPLVTVMPGRGVRPDNLASLQSVTRAEEFHGTALP